MPKVLPLVLLTPVSTTVSDVWTFGFFPQFDERIFPDLSNITYEIWMDTVDNFSSPNLKKFTNQSPLSTELILVTKGALGTSFDVKLPGPDRSVAVTWFWRARINTSKYTSYWTTGIALVIPTHDQQAIVQTMWDNLADENFYSKEGNSTDLFIFFNSIARQLRSLQVETSQTQLDLYIESVRDEALQRNFGTLVGLSRLSDEASVDYRIKVRSLWNVFVKSQLVGSNSGIIESVKAFVIEPPTITDERTLIGWTLGEHYIKDPLNPTLLPVITLYDSQTKGFGWILDIFNSWGLTIDEDQITDFLKKVIPVHTKVTTQFSDARHMKETYNISQDWARCSLTDVDQVGDYVRLNNAASALAVDANVPDSFMRFHYEANELPQNAKPVWSRSLSGSVLHEEIQVDNPATSRKSLYIEMPGAGIGDNYVLTYSVNPSSITGDPFLDTRGNIIKARLKVGSGVVISGSEDPNFAIRVGTNTYVSFGSSTTAIQDISGTIHSTVASDNTSYNLYIIYSKRSGTDIVVTVWKNGVEILSKTTTDTILSTVNLRFSSTSDTKPNVAGNIDYVYSCNVPRVGTILGPSVDAEATLTVWRAFSELSTLSGQVIGFQVRSSSDNSTWSSWESLTQDESPSSTPLARYFQLSAILATFDDATPITLLPILKEMNLRMINE